jgi:hypothetical protein
VVRAHGLGMPNANIGIGKASRPHGEILAVVLEAVIGHERTALSRQIEHTDAEIDRLVYELYGLSEEEIALVEGATA